jgi:hypothetical protein
MGARGACASSVVRKRKVTAECEQGAGKMESERPYQELRKQTQSILQTGTQAYGEASTFAEMNTGSTEEILDTFFPSAEACEGAVVMDIGSGLGNFPFRAVLRHGVRTIGIEYNRECHMQTVSLLQAMLQTERFDRYDLAEKCFFVYGDAENLVSLEGVTHLYMFNKSMPSIIFIKLAEAAARCKSLRYVVSHYNLTHDDYGWQNLELIKTVSSTLTGSGAGVSTRVYRITQPSTPKIYAPARPIDEAHRTIQPQHALGMLDTFKGWQVEDVIEHWVRNALCTTPVFDSLEHHDTHHRRRTRAV